MWTETKILIMKTLDTHKKKEKKKKKERMKAFLPPNETPKLFSFKTETQILFGKIHPHLHPKILPGCCHSKVPNSIMGKEISG